MIEQDNQNYFLDKINTIILETLGGSYKLKKLPTIDISETVAIFTKIRRMEKDALKTYLSSFSG